MMRGKKNLAWRNELGQEVVFDNRVLFLEAIDMIGTPGIHTAESLAMSDGQRTIRHQLGAKTIPCSFAIKDVGNVEWLKNRLTEVFFPKLSGTMTVETMYGHYEIECYPLNVPTFKMAENDGVWRFDVDFVADDPYWRKGGEHVRTLTGPSHETLMSSCPFDIYPVIEFPAADNSRVIAFKNSLGENTIHIVEHDFPIRLTTKPFSMLNMNTNTSCTNYLTTSQQVGNLVIRYGENKIQGVTGYITDIVIRYYELSMGEI